MGEALCHGTQVEVKRQPEKPGSGDTPLIPELRRQRQVDLCEFKTNLVYRASFKATQRDSVLKKKKNLKDGSI